MVVHRVIIFTLAVTAGACGSTSVSQLSGPGDVACSVSASAPQQTLSPSGDRVSVPMTASRDCLWSASSNASWLQVSPASGQGGGALVVSASANPGSDTRIGTVSVNSLPITIVQAGTPPVASSAAPSPAPDAGSPAPTPAPTPVPSCQPSVSPLSIAVGPDGGSGQIAVSIAPGCAWSAVSSAGWIGITAGGSGTGSGVVRYVIDVQKGKPTRTGTVVVAGVTVTVSQTGKA